MVWEALKYGPPPILIGGKYMDKVLELIEEMLESFKYLLDQAMHHTTKIYDGVIVKSASNGKWQIKFNGDIKELPIFGSGTPELYKNVKVIIPQGNMNLAYFVM